MDRYFGFEVGLYIPLMMLLTLKTCRSSRGEKPSTEIWHLGYFSVMERNRR